MSSQSERSASNYFELPKPSQPVSASIHILKSLQGLNLTGHTRSSRRAATRRGKKGRNKRGRGTDLKGKGLSPIIGPQTTTLKLEQGILVLTLAIDRSESNDELTEVVTGGRKLTVSLSLVFDSGDESRGSISPSRQIRLTCSPIQEIYSLPPSASSLQVKAMTILNDFLKQLNEIVKSQDGTVLSQYLVIEPDREGKFPETYQKLAGVVQTYFPANDNAGLETVCENALPYAVNGVDGTSWNEFVRFTAAYLRYLTKLDVNNLLDAYALLSDLVQKSTSALKHQSLGIVILPTVIICSQALASFAIQLDARPELLRSMRRAATEDGARESLPERCANTIRGAFTECFKDRTGPPSGVIDGKPAGKRIGIYILVNMCLRVIFKCNKLEAASTIIEQAAQYSPPLSVFPKAHQVTYLFYLGRFHFATSHFYEAHCTLTEAYNLCPKAPSQLSMACLKQRRLILIYLIAANLVCGLIPSQKLLSQPEAADLAPQFMPLITAIRKGDLTEFLRITDFQSPFAPFFFRHQIAIHLANRCKVHVWRSLVRKTFMIAGDRGNPKQRIAPTLSLKYVTQLRWWMEKNARENQGKIVDPDFQIPGQPGASTVVGPTDAPDEMETVSMMSSLIGQGFVNGFLSLKKGKLAIRGAKQKGPLASGFPRIWEVVHENADDDVPGWRRGTADSAGDSGNGSAPGPGTVIRLSGARPAGMD